MAYTPISEKTKTTAYIPISEKPKISGVLSSTSLTGFKELDIASVEKYESLADKEILTPKPTLAQQIKSGRFNIFKQFKSILQATPEERRGLANKLLFDLPMTQGERAKTKLEDLRGFGKGEPIRILTQVGSGILGTAEGFAGAVEWAGVEKAKPIADKLSQWRKDLEPEHRTFVDNLASGVGSAITFFVPGFGIMKGAGMIARVSPTVAKWFGAVSSAFLESATEAGSIYRELKEQGKSDTEASSAATKDFWVNAIIVSVTNKLGIFGDKAKGLKRALLSANVEGIQEAAQQITSNVLSGKAWDEGVLESGAIGAIIGGGIGAGTPKGVDVPVSITPPSLGLSIVDVSKGIPPELEPLAQEARKFKSAEEFVEAQPKRFIDDIKIFRKEVAEETLEDIRGEIPDFTSNNDGTILLYHKTTKEAVRRIEQSGKFNEGSYFALSEDAAEALASTNKKGTPIIMEVRVDPASISYSSEEAFAEYGLQKMGNKWQISDEKLKEVFDVAPQTKSQLTDFYNQAVKAEKVMTQQMEADIAEAKKLGITSLKEYTEFLQKKEKPFTQKQRLLEQARTFKLEDLEKISEEIQKKEITIERFNELNEQVKGYETLVENDPARELQRYSPTRGNFKGILPEVTGKGTNEFARRGDDIASELGFEDSEQAREAFEQYQESRTKLKELRAQLTETRKTKAAVRKGERLMQLAKGDRRIAYRAVRNAFDLTESELGKIRQGKDIMAMTEREFSDFITQAELMAEGIEEKRQSVNELLSTIQEKELRKWENVREAIHLPPIAQMTVEQVDQLNEVLSQYKTADEFLTVRQLETIDRTELKGLRTIRETNEHLAQKYGLTTDQLPGIKPHPWMYDAQLARQHPLYDLLVDKYNVSYLNAQSRIIELEREINELLNVARKSRDRGVTERLVPTDKKVADWLNAAPGEKPTDLTPQELRAAERMDEIFHEYYDYLIKRSVEQKFSSRFEDKYFPHVRRGFLEAWKEDGFLKGVKESFDQFKQEERVMTILDEKTGDVLPYEKWIGFSQFRTGALVPTQNAARAFKSYVTALEKARQFDSFIPEIMVYVHALSPREMTQRGLEMNDSLQRFIKTWINSKKGRVQKQIVTPGSKADWALRLGVALTRIRDLGVNIPVGIANIFGEQAGNLTMLGAKKYAIGLQRLATQKGRAITKKYENYVGRTLWDKLTEASNTVGDQLLGGIFGLFSSASRKGNQVFLLGNMTNEEFDSQTISTERLAQLRKAQGKYRVVEGAESIFGKSAEAAVGGQYKKWAIPILVSTKDNAIQFSKIVRSRGVKAALSSNEGSQLFYSVLLGSSLGLALMGYYKELEDDDDKNFIEEIIYKSMRDALSMIGALNPRFIGSFAAPRLASFIVDISEAIENLLFMERYKTTGELKGIKELKRTLTPTIIKSLFKETEEETEKKTKSLAPIPKLPTLPKLPKIPSLPKV